MAHALDLTVLKKRLKLHGFTYVDVAQHLGMSVPGVKKLFNKGDISLSKWIAVCELLGIAPDDLLKETRLESIRPTRINPEHIRRFVSEPSLFNFMMRLLYEQVPLPELVARYNLTPRSVFKYLRGLDQMGLIELREGNRFRLMHERIRALSTSGTGLEALKKKQTLDLISRTSTKGHGRLFGGVFYLTAEEIQICSAELFALVEKYTQRSMANRSYRGKNGTEVCKDFTVMVQSAEGTLFEPISNAI